MDARLAYWSFALVNMIFVVGIAAAGVRSVRRGETARHRRCMLTAATLVVLFVVSYVVKLATLGREALATWGALSIWVLRIHELCVLTMVLAGAVALSRALRLRGSRNFTRRPEDPPAPAASVRWHRGAGATAVWAAALGLLLAACVLAGMYRRAGWF
jgi:uncharacterized membrane protein YozB (DUF420 family)